MNEIQAVTEVAHSVSDYGALIVIGASFIVLSLLMWVAIFKWFKTIINRVIERSNSDMVEILTETKKQNDMLSDISEGLRNETQIRLRNLTGMANNLNQLTKLSHQTGFYRTKNIVMELLAKLKEVLSDYKAEERRCR